MLGIIKESTVHFKLPVSFFIVIKVVPHGKCSNDKIIILIAVRMVQPLLIKICDMSDKFSKCSNVPALAYPIKIIGKTISFAGNPNINAVIIFPSKPKSFQNGSKKFATYVKMLISFI